jgi:hypothetical protein
MAGAARTGPPHLLVGLWQYFCRGQAQFGLVSVVMPSVQEVRSGGREVILGCGFHSLARSAAMALCSYVWSCNP